MVWGDAQEQWSGPNGITYAAYSTKQFWRAAFKSCQDLGGRLAIIDNPQLQAELRNHGML